MVRIRICFSIIITIIVISIVDDNAAHMESRRELTCLKNHSVQSCLASVDKMQCHLAEVSHPCN